VVEFADHLEEHSRLVFLRYRCHPGEGGAVVSHRLFASRPLTLAGVDQNELAVLRVTALPVAGQTLLNPDLSPDLVLEIVVHGCGAPHYLPGKLVLAANDGGRSQPGHESKKEKASILEHEALVSPESAPARTNRGRRRRRTR